MIKTFEVQFDYKGECYMFWYDIDITNKTKENIKNEIGDKSENLYNEDGEYIANVDLEDYELFIDEMK